MKGSIRRENGNWVAQWSTRDPATGLRRQCKKRGFRTKGAAQRHLNAVLAAVDAGSWRPDRPLTVKELLTEYWLPARRLQGLRPATLSMYERAVRDWVTPHVGAQKVAALRPADVSTLIEILRTTKTVKGKAGLSPRSVQLAINCLTAACKWGAKTELLARNPLAGVDRPLVKSPTMKAWTADEAREFLAATRDDRLAFAWALLLTRGLRRGELCGLTWSAVDLDAGTLQVTETLVVVDGKPVFSSPKTSAGRRSVPLDGHLVALLRAHRARQAAERLAAGEAYHDAGYLLANELGEPYHPDTISGWFDDAGKAAKVRRIRLHDTRHTSASLMLASGVPVKVVSEMLGHASPTITLSIYAHVLPGMAEEAGAALSSALLA